MGNKIARTTQGSASEYYLQDLPSSYNLVLKEVLGRGRFLKSILCKHDEGLVLVKVYFKRGDSVDLRDYEKKLDEIQQTLKNIQNSHVWPFQCWFETDKAAYLLRQYFFSNLHDRLSTRPFLSTIEKKWLAFQLLYALKQSHDNGVCHGDIKCENVLVTSWNWVYLADYASFKPTYIPDDDPSDFSFYFDTGGRRRCYVAPERFCEPGSFDDQLAGNATLKPSMDIFSLGCVVAELFLEGQSIFELSQLLAYRRGQYDPGPHLDKIPDEGIRNMISHMIQLHPEARLSCDSYLQSYAITAFPSYFSAIFHNFFSCLIPLDTDKRVQVIQRAFPEILDMTTKSSGKGESDPFKKMTSANTNDMTAEVANKQSSRLSVKMRDLFKKNVQSGDSNAVNSASELITDITSLQKQLDQRQQKEGKQPTDLGLQLANNISWKNDGFLRKHWYGKDSVCYHQNSVFPYAYDRYFGNGYHDCENALTKGIQNQNCESVPELTNGEILKSEGMVLIASLLCACVRNVNAAKARRSVIMLLLKSSYYIDDEDRLQHVLPYIVAMLSDPSAIVRSAALQTLCNVLALVTEFPPSDAKIFPEYILPMLSTLPEDPEESVRICYADNIYKIATTATRFLHRSKELSHINHLEKSNFSNKGANGSYIPHQTSGLHFPQVNGNAEAELFQLRQAIAHVIQELVMGPKQTPNVRRALLSHVKELCDFFGEKQCNDFLLPNLPAFLNDQDEQLRSVFFEQIVHVCYFVGQISVEEYLLPYVEQALAVDVEEVIVNALKCLAFLANKKLLRKRLLLVAVQRAAPLLCHPSLWVRKSAVTFIAASSESLNPVDSHVYISPILRPFLRREPASLSSEVGLQSCLKSPMSRKVFNQVLDKLMSLDTSKSSKSKQLEVTSKTLESSVLTAESGVVKKEASVSLVITDPNRSLPSKSLDTKNAGPSVQNPIVVQGEDTIKMKAMENYILSLSTTMQTREHNRDLESSKKIQSSGMVGNAFANTANGSSFNLSFEGIPVYTCPVNERSADGTEKGWPAVGLSVNEEWKQETGGQQESAQLLQCSYSGAQTSGSTVTLQKNVLGSNQSFLSSMQFPYKPNSKAASLPPKFYTSPLLNSSLSNAKQANRTINMSVQDSAYGTNRINLMKDTLVQGMNAKVNPTSADQVASSMLLASEGAWRPRGVLVAHLHEHQSAVNDIAVSSDNNFFVTASDDGTVKIWDSRRLEKDISFRSRLTYPLDNGRALHATMFASESFVAVGSSTGTIRIFSVNYAPKGGSTTERYSEVSNVDRKETQEGAVLSLQSFGLDGPPMLLYSTQLNRIHLWDLRARRNSWTLKANPEEGYLSAVVLGPCQNWLVSGSSAGVLTLWDLRFLIPLNTWKYPLICPIENMCLLVPPSNVPMYARDGPLIYVAAGFNEMALCNVKDGSFHRIFRPVCSVTGPEITESSTSMRSSNQRPSRSRAKTESQHNGQSKFRVHELNDPPPRIAGIRALLSLQGGDVLTGGTDWKIRLWDHASPDRSYCICGPSAKYMGKESYAMKSINGVQVVQEGYKYPDATKLMSKAYIGAAATDSTGCHRDSVLSLASIQLSQRLLVSSSRDGAVKVWK